MDLMDHVDMLVFYLPSPVSVTPSMERDVTGTPSNATRILTMASSDAKRLLKAIFLKSNITEEQLVGFSAKLIYMPCGNLYFYTLTKKLTIFKYCM